ncbi:short-chain dehydrogenase/oxidoreductase [Secundilactobacillus pentosiphilus]|uniref:Short-chain dehydrogenase/oxidoreductase n=1 Tax=Secundilactobacillus pentosiphilus TaxID=1714682 RepID=A0A1Z5IR10_9LACO|nr:SDR family NAD(P)-dependent oxidoreductase [Secundilactobacillus pentosiphilus]GAX04197.1 short-chain dehydrogenase/oxidoreductase [Secundilactobacillus pentosiphilus]
MTKTVMITGANSGLGFETTKQIAERGSDYQLIMACRNMEKARAAKARILESIPDANLICLELDTSSLAKVRAFVAAFKQMNLPLYGLVCNAGISGRTVSQTDDGFSNIFETNYLGHFLLTQLLLPLMAHNGRIVTVSSERHDAPLKGVSWPGVKALAYGGDAQVDQLSYPFSKLCMILFSYELDRKLKESGKQIAVNTVNPGLMTETGLAKDKSRFTPEVLAQFADIIGTAKDSGKMITDLICAEQFAKGPAKYYDRSSDKPVKSSDLSYDKQVQQELWDFSMKAAGLSK